jgi:hypothetical protein
MGQHTKSSKFERLLSAREEPDCFNNQLGKGGGFSGCFNEELEPGGCVNGCLKGTMGKKQNAVIVYFAVRRYSVFIDLKYCQCVLREREIRASL